jgi:hypothetical protein
MYDDSYDLWPCKINYTDVWMVFLSLLDQKLQQNQIIYDYQHFCIMW